MNADTIIKQDGMKTLMDKLGLVEAERFIMLIQREVFNYTKWQENLFEDMSLEELNSKAVEYAVDNNLDYNL